MRNMPICKMNASVRDTETGFGPATAGMDPINLVAHAGRQRVRARPRLTPEPTMRMNLSLLLGCLVALSACASQPVRGESPPPRVAKSADVTAIEGMLESFRTAI